MHGVVLEHPAACCSDIGKGRQRFVIGGAVVGWGGQVEALGGLSLGLLLCSELEAARAWGAPAEGDVDGLIVRVDDLEEK